MGLKSLFINSDDNANNEPVKQATAFPVKEVKLTMPTKTVSEEPIAEKKTNFFGFGNVESTPVSNFANVTTNVNDEDLNKAIEIYQNGFTSLNQPGYDFYEFYQTVISGGAGNNQIYPMAFTMGRAMDGSVTKDKLLQQSGYYLEEINKVYTDYVSKGNQKKTELTLTKTNETQSLVEDLSLMNQQLEALKVQIQDRTSKLSAIDSKYAPKISEVVSKLMANDLAKSKLIESIEQVKQGIINNIA